jgi:hypothetical protein
MVTKCYLESSGYTSPHTGVGITVKLRVNAKVEVLERPQVAKQAVCGPLTRGIVEEAAAVREAVKAMAREHQINLNEERPVRAATSQELQGLELRQWASKYLRFQYQLKQDEEIHSEPVLRTQGIMQTISSSGVDRSKKFAFWSICGNAVEGRSSAYRAREGLRTAGETHPTRRGNESGGSEFLVILSVTASPPPPCRSGRLW